MLGCWIALAWVVGACDSGESVEPATAKAAAAAAEPAEPAEAVAAEPEAVAEPAVVEPAVPTEAAVQAPSRGPAFAPEPESFDPLASTEVDVRITRILDKGQGPCGVLHSVGALEVEVLGAGEPAPTLILYVSCPNDVAFNRMIAVGASVHVTLHAHRQSWPKPRVELPEGVVVRYVRSMDPAT